MRTERAGLLASDDALSVGDLSEDRGAGIPRVATRNDHTMDVVPRRGRTGLRARLCAAVWLRERS